MHSSVMALLIVQVQLWVVKPLQILNSSNLYAFLLLSTSVLVKLAQTMSSRATILNVLDTTIRPRNSRALYKRFSAM